MGNDLKGRKLGDGVTQRKDGRYCARFTNRYGKRVEKCSHNINEVKVWLAEQKALDQLKQNRVDDTVTINSWFDTKWVSIFKAELSPNTLQQYKMVYDKYIRNELGFKKMCNVQTSDVKELLLNIKSLGLGYETQRRVRIMMLDMFNRAMDDQVVSFNPVKSIKLERDEEIEPFVLSPRDKKDFFDVAKGTFYYRMYVTHLYTGVRPGELFALTWDDIDFENKTIRINKTLVYQKYEGDTCKEFHIGPPKTKQSNRVLNIGDYLCNILLEQKRVHDILVDKLCDNRKEQLCTIIDTRYDSDFYKNISYNDLVFTTKYISPICVQIYNDSIKALVDVINLQRCSVDELECFSGHAFRHTFATQLYEDTKNLKLVSKRLGHARLETTANLYVHNTEESELDCINILEETCKNLDE